MSVIRDIANQADCGSEMKLAQMSASARPSTLSENLESKKAALEGQLAIVNKALDALKANPNFEEMINLLARV